MIVALPLGWGIALAFMHRRRSVGAALALVGMALYAMLFPWHTVSQTSMLLAQAGLSTSAASASWQQPTHRHPPAREIRPPPRGTGGTDSDRSAGWATRELYRRLHTNAEPIPDPTLRLNTEAPLSECADRALSYLRHRLPTDPA